MSDTWDPKGMFSEPSGHSANRERWLKQIIKSQAKVNLIITSHTALMKFFENF